MKKRVMCLLVMVTFICLCSLTAYSQEDVDLNVSNLSKRTSSIGGPIGLIGVNIHGVSGPDDTRISPNYVGTLQKEVLAGTSQLTSENPFDAWIFNVEQGDSRYLFTKFTSANTDYCMYICRYDETEGILTPLVSVSNGDSFVAIVEEGSYAFYLFSTDTLGDSYNLYYNFAVPSSIDGSIYYLNDDFSVVIMSSTIGGNINYYCNGDLLNFEREWRFDWTEGLYSCYNHRVVKFTNTKISVPLSGTYTYNSTYVYSDNVILIPIMSGTNYMSWSYLYHSNPYVENILNQEDCYGNHTPRTLSVLDEGDNFIVYDLTDNTIVDVFGPLNSFYTVFGQDRINSITLN